MRFRVGQLLAIAALGAAGVATDALAQQDFIPQSKLTGSARITGRVIAADDGKPVRRASFTCQAILIRNPITSVFHAHSKPTSMVVSIS